MSQPKVALLLSLALVVALAAALVAGLPVVVPGLWLALAVLAASYWQGPRGVVPAAALSAGVVILTQDPGSPAQAFQQVGVLAAWYVAFGLMTSWAFHLLFRRLDSEHRLRVAEVETERNNAVALVREREQLQRQLTHSATHDPLTGLANRSLLLDSLDRVLSATRQTGMQCAVMFVDLDDFKAVNDEHGHAAGDQLLRIVASRLEHALREGDLVARLGGDEFAVLFPELPTEAAESVVSRVLDALNAPVSIAGRMLPVQASVGLALSDGTDVPMELLGKADLAMYAVKGQGKNDLAVYAPEMQATAQARRLLEEELGRAVSDGQLRLFYQPLVSLADGALLGFEALVRWEHPERGLVRPDDFIPVAEATGAIIPIGRWVLLEACRQLRAWGRSRPTGEPLHLAVNLSARQLADPDVVTDLQNIVMSSGVDPRSLVLEVTESLAMDEETAVEKLWQLKALGVRIAIDDFGTGYSSLSRLGRLPLDKLKIDKSFVLALAGSPAESRAAATLIRSSVAMAHGLGLSVVAEGVERPEDVGLLRHVGCEHGQGYLFGRPAPACDFDVSRMAWLLAAPSGELLEWDPEADSTAAALMPSATTRHSTGTRSFRGLASLSQPAVAPLPGPRTTADPYTGPERRRAGHYAAS